MEFPVRPFSYINSLAFGNTTSKQTIYSYWEAAVQSEKREEQENHDVKERDNMYVVEIELPEYVREDIQALFNDGYLIVTACEFKKAYYIGRNVSQENIRAAFHNGVLKCMITKSEKDNGDGPVEIEIM